MSTATTQSEPSSPRYREIESMLYERIRKGQLKPGDRLDSTDALAQELEVGVGTVNQALSALASRGLLTRRPRIGTVVSHGVDAIIAQPRPARSVAIYAVLVPDQRIPAFSGMVRHLQEILCGEQIHVSIFNIEGQPDVSATAIDHCIDDNVDAVLLVPPLFDKIPLQSLLKLEQSGIPVVTCWRSAGIDAWPLVHGDPRDVIATPALHLLDKGCKRVVMFKDQVVRDPSTVDPITPLTPDCDPQVQLEFIRALGDRGIAVRSDDLIRVNHGVDALQPGGLTGQKTVVDALADWLEARPDVDGILCTYDIVAGLTLEALNKIGRRVPEDVAVTGGGNLRAYAWYFAASLTSVDPDLEAVAREACTLFKAIRNGQRFGPGHTVSVPWKLVKGESTARG